MLPEELKAEEANYKRKLGLIIAINVLMFSVVGLVGLLFLACWLVLDGCPS